MIFLSNLNSLNKHPLHCSKNSLASLYIFSDEIMSIVRSKQGLMFAIFVAIVDAFQVVRHCICCICFCLLMNFRKIFVALNPMIFSNVSHNTCESYLDSKQVHPIDMNCCAYPFWTWIVT